MSMCFGNSLCNLLNCLVRIWIVNFLPRLFLYLNLHELYTLVFKLTFQRILVRLKKRGFQNMQYAFNFGQL